MYNILYFVMFYIIEIVLLVIILIVLFACGFFSKDSHKKAPKSTIDFLIEQVKDSNGDKETLDAVMREFYAQFYTISRENKHFEKWLELISAITLLEYMTVEQTAKFRDDLSTKNPSVKKEIERHIGESLKYREQNQKTKR